MGGCGMARAMVFEWVARNRQERAISLLTSPIFSPQYCAQVDRAVQYQ